MKIKALLVSCMLMSGIASAQMNQASGDSNGGENLKATAGSKSFEVNFTPFSGSPISLSYLKGRYFVADDVAYRAGISLVVNTSEPNSSFEFTLAPGIEKHFAGTRRLSPYYGAELILAGRSSSSNQTIGNTTRETSGAWNDGSNRGYFSFGLNGLLGCDYYFSKNIFMGFEAGYGLRYVGNSQVQVTVNGQTEVAEESASAFRIAPNFNSAIRLGFVF